MFKSFKIWFKNRQEQKYLEYTKYSIAYDIANQSFTIPHDYLERIKERFDKLEKFKIRQDKFQELKMIYKIRKVRIKLSIEDFYYGIPYTNTHLSSGTLGTSVTIYRRDKKKITSIPLGFLLTEKQWHSQNFNKKFDKDILKDE